VPSGREGGRRRKRRGGMMASLVDEENVVSVPRHTTP